MELSLVFGIPYSMLRETMPAWELQLYRYFVLANGPIGLRRDDYRMAMIVGSQCGKCGDTIEKFLPKFSYQKREDWKDLTLEEQKSRAMRVAASITRQCRGNVKKGPLLTISFKKGELRRIKHDGDGSESGG